MSEQVAELNGENPAKKGRGRPRKILTEAESAAASEKMARRQEKESAKLAASPAAPAKNPRGRPLKQHSWPAEQVEKWPIGKLRPAPKNARVHSDEQVSQLVALIRQFGFTSPVLVAADGTVIAGHARLQALTRLAVPEVPVIVARGWSKNKQRAFAIADNQLALNSQWDEEILSIELHDLKAQDVDLGVLGFAGKDLDRLLQLDLAQGEKGDQPGKTPVLNAVIQYNIVFENDAQQKKWFEFIRWLKAEFPEEKTTASRFSAYFDTLNLAKAKTK